MSRPYVVPTLKDGQLRLVVSDPIDDHLDLTLVEARELAVQILAALPGPDLVVDVDQSDESLCGYVAQIGLAGEGERVYARLAASARHKLIQTISERTRRRIRQALGIPEPS